MLFDHADKGGAAGGGHQAAGRFGPFDKFAGFFYRDCIRADRNFLNIMEADFQQAGPNLTGLDLNAELADKGRGQQGVDPSSGLDPLDDLHNHRTVGDGAEGAGDLAGAAVDALIIIDYCFAGFVGGDGAQFAGTFAGPRNFNDRAIRARSFAQTAFDAFRFINEGTVGDNRNRFFGTAGNAAMGQTVATGVGHDETVQRTLVAGDR